MCWLALLTVGCFHSSVVSKPSDLVGRWTLPGSEGFVDFAETGSMALVSDSTGAVGYFKVQPGSKVEVESATNAGLSLMFQIVFLFNVDRTGRMGMAAAAA